MNCQATLFITLLCALLPITEGLIAQDSDRSGQIRIDLNRGSLMLPGGEERTFSPGDTATLEVSGPPLSIALNTGTGPLTLQYRLQGISRVWYDLPAGSNYLHYPALPPGRYTFSLRTRPEPDRTAAPILSLKVRVQGKWWATRWAKGVALALALLLIIAGTAGVIRRQKDNQEENPVVEAPPVKEIKPENTEPRTPVDLKAPPLPVTPPDLEIIEHPDSPLILVVEDDVNLVNFLVQSLNAEFNLAVAYNGEDGTRIAREQIPDLIVSDVVMPKKDGFEMCYSLKNDQTTSHIPIIMLTSKTDVESRLQGLRQGADAYLEKPFYQEELETRIEGLLAQRTRLQQYYLAQSGLAEGDTDTENRETGGQQREQAFLAEINEIIRANLSTESFSVEELSKRVFMDPSNLYRKVKALTGLSPLQYILSFRLAMAKKLLRSNDEPIANIASDCGFRSANYFARVFKKETGQTPSEYRQHPS